MPLRGRQRTRRYNNNAGALMIFWKPGGPTFSEKSRLKTGSDSVDRPPLSARGAVCIGSRLKKQNRKKTKQKKTKQKKTNLKTYLSFLLE
jgi:hypothetical protein